MPRRSTDHDALAETLAASIRTRRAAFSAELARHGLRLVPAAEAPEYQDDTTPLCYPAEASPGSGAVR